MKQVMKNKSFNGREEKILDTTHKACANLVLVQKHNKSTKSKKNSNNRYDGVTEYIGFENMEYEEVSFQKNIEEIKK